jgi:lipopolysaccharide export system permease protein
MSTYLGRRFLFAVLVSFGIFLSVIYMIDLVELMRRAANQDNVAFSTLTTMALLRLPTVGSETLPFAILFGAMAAFTRLTRNHELVVVRSAGVSVWQFLLPAFLVAFLIGIFIITIYNPIAAAMSSRYEQIDSKYLRGKSSLLAVSANGLWLRQADRNGQSVIHARRVSEYGVKLNDVVILLYSGNDTFKGRIDARTAELGDGHWKLQNVWVAGKEDAPQHFDNYQLSTTMTYNDVMESFANPDTISFWDLPHFIATAEAAGFTVRRYLLHFYDVLATPVLLCTMVLVAAAFSLRVSRLGGVVQLILGGVFAGFLLYFVSDLSLALGLSGKLPPFLAAWTTSIVAMMLGLAVLFHLEDG